MTGTAVFPSGDVRGALRHAAVIHMTPEKEELQ